MDDRSFEDSLQAARLQARDEAPLQRIRASLEAKIRPARRGRIWIPALGVAAAAIFLMWWRSRSLLPRVPETVTQEVHFSALPDQPRVFCILHLEDGGTVAVIQFPGIVSLRLCRAGDRSGAWTVANIADKEVILRTEPSGPAVTLAPETLRTSEAAWLTNAAEKARPLSSSEIEIAAWEAQWGAKAAVDALLRIARDPRHPSGAAVAALLAGGGCFEDIDLVIRQLRDPHNQYREPLARGLAKAKSPLAARVLEELARDATAPGSLRIAALQALAEREAGEAVIRLEELAADTGVPPDLQTEARRLLATCLTAPRGQGK